MAKTFVIGDIHGAYRALVQVLQRAKFDCENDTLISLGDVVDGWHETYWCIEELLKIKNLIAIRGNHDEWAMKWMVTGVTQTVWLSQGGMATVESYHACGMNDAHRQFLVNQHDYYIDADNNLFVHGGYNPYIGLQGTIRQEGRSSLYWTRMLCDLHPNVVYNYTKGQFNKIFIGHTAHDKDIHIAGTNVYNLDTGAGWYGKLSIMCVEDMAVYQSDNVGELYPGMRGRG